jgi:ATP synthase protein I
MNDRTPPRFNYRKLAALSSLGLILPSSIAVGLFLGYFLDNLLGTAPWLLIILTLLGVASGFLSLFRGIKKFGLEKDNDL